MYIRDPPFCRTRAAEHQCDAAFLAGHFRLILQDVYRRLDKMYDPVRARLSFR